VTYSTTSPIAGSAASAGVNISTKSSFLPSSQSASWSFTNGSNNISSASISLNGNIVLLGFSSLNTAYIYEKSNNSWSNTAVFTISNSSAYFGISVALSSDGSVALIGATSDIYNGAGYIFTRSGVTWSSSSTPTATLYNNAILHYISFARSVALSGDGGTVLIGASGDPYNTSTSTDGPGRAYIYVRNGSNWANMSTPTATLSIGTGKTGDQFGRSVALNNSGDTALIGAPGAPYNSGNGPGRAYIFAKGSSWASMTSPTVTLSYSGSVAYDNFGYSVTLSGDGGTAVIGAPEEGSSAGGVYVYVRSGANWSNMTTATSGLGYRYLQAGEKLGTKVIISNDGSVIAADALYAKRTPSTNTNGPGKVCIYSRPTNGWSGTAYQDVVLSSSYTQQGIYGTAIALNGDGTQAVINDTPSSTAYIYVYI
jgi:hypothetical protein